MAQDSWGGETRTGAGVVRTGLGAMLLFVGTGMVIVLMVVLGTTP